MIKKLLILLMVILLVISPSFVFATDAEATSNTGTAENAEQPATDEESNSIESLNDDTWGLEWTITDLNLAIGDSITALITRIVGQKITIQSLIFNEVDSLNANFFSKDTNGTSMHKIVKENIIKWYGVFQEIAIVFYLAAILVVGMKTVLSESAISRASMKDSIMTWITGLFILFMFNFVMKYAFEINETFVEMVKDEFGTKGHSYGTYVGDADEFALENFEFRSPEYRSKYTGVLTYGGEAVNNAYLKRLGDYANTADMMRIMRAYAGVSHKIIFCIIWLILLFQLIIMLVKYYKRYFVIALLIIALPFVSISYLIDKLRGGRGEAFRLWCVEFFVNVFTQSIHAIIYAIIAATCIDRVTKEINSGSSTMNWIIIIVAINFLSKGEKLVRKLLGADGSKSMTAISDSAQAGKAGRERGMANAGRIRGMFSRRKG